MENQRGGRSALAREEEDRDYRLGSVAWADNFRVMSDDLESPRIVMKELVKEIQKLGLYQKAESLW